MVKTQLAKALDSLVTHAALLFIIFLLNYPVLYTLMTSFKSDLDVVTIPPSFFPPKWVLTAYEMVFGSDMLRLYLPNTMINALLSCLVVIPIASLSAYAFSRYRFRGSDALQLAILAAWMIPRLPNLLPLYRLGSELGLMKTRIPLVAAHVAFGLPISIWIIKSFMDAIPRELDEAALLDGCSPLQALWHVTIRLAAPGMLGAFLLVFVESWNEFLAAVALVVTNEMKTATLGLYDFQSAYELSFHVLAAGCIVIALPVLILFYALRRTFFRALMEGAIKG